MTDKTPTGGPYSGMLSEIVRGLRRQPILLFGLGGAIVILAAGTAVLDDRRSITMPILIVLAISAVGWIALEAIRARGTSKATGRTTTGGVGIGLGAKVGTETTLRTAVDGQTPAGDTSTGNIKIGPGARVGRGVRIDTGVTGASGRTEGQGKPPSK
jgi:hypothetical protein